MKSAHAQFNLVTVGSAKTKCIRHNKGRTPNASKTRKTEQARSQDCTWMGADTIFSEEGAHPSALEFFYETLSIFHTLIHILTRGVCSLRHPWLGAWRGPKAFAFQCRYGVRKVESFFFIIFVIVIWISSPYLHSAKAKSKHYANPIFILFARKNKRKS